LVPGSTGDFFWGGAAGPSFWVDPQEDLIGLFLTQCCRRRRIRCAASCARWSIARSPRWVPLRNCCADLSTIQRRHLRARILLREIAVRPDQMPPAGYPGQSNA